MTPLEIGIISAVLAALIAVALLFYRECWWRARRRYFGNILAREYPLMRKRWRSARQDAEFWEGEVGDLIKRSELQAQIISHLRKRKPEHTALANKKAAELQALTHEDLAQ